MTQRSEHTDFEQAPVAMPTTAGGAAAPERAPRRRAFTRAIIAVAVVLAVAGVAVISYPAITDLWNTYQQSITISEYEDAVSGISSEDVEAILAKARDYNATLAGNGDRYHMTDEEKAAYEALLDPTGNGVMGHVHIGTINVSYPIYHGMDESVLQGAIGHLEGTSLPVGGAGTHTAISGHRGLPSARLFTDLDKLVAGDTFTITVLGRTQTYEVDQIRIVLPTDMADLAIEPGRDLATLVTCTPYGVNSHRLLVRGHRVTGAVDEALASDAVQVPISTAIPAVGLPLLLVFLVALLVYLRTRRPVIDKAKVAAAIRKDALGSDEGEGD